MEPGGSQERADSSATAKFRVGQRVRISKVKMKFAKARNKISLPKYLASLK